jgi:hypothetical protein
MNASGALRAELRERALAWAAQNGVPYYASLGQTPTVLFERAPGGAYHGNFHPDAWNAILANEAWRGRLEKRHSQPQALPPEKASEARELDSSNSSDALLMNCFCPPDATQRIFFVLGYADCGEAPEFGFKPGVQLLPEGADTTEIDMRVGPHFFEAKLTEKDFTTCSRADALRYANFDQTFDVDALPWLEDKVSRENDTLSGYQLVRNVLAAEQHGGTLTILIDQRRPDLLQAWWAVHAAIRCAGLRRRCGFRTWQEIAAASSPSVAGWLRRKYGF